MLDYNSAWFPVILLVVPVLGANDSCFTWLLAASFIQVLADLKLLLVLSFVCMPASQVHIQNMRIGRISTICRKCNKNEE